MPPARTAAAARTGSRRPGRASRFVWIAGAAQRITPRRLVTAAALLVYLTAVTAPAWHGHAGHEHGGHDEEAAAVVSACGHHHGAHEHGARNHGSPGHEHAGQESEDGEPDCPPHGEDDCRICELIATPATPVAPPVLIECGAALPDLDRPPGVDRRAVFLRTQHARGPPRA